MLEDRETECALNRQIDKSSLNLSEWVTHMVSLCQHRSILASIGSCINGIKVKIALYEGSKCFNYNLLSNAPFSFQTAMMLECTGDSERKSFDNMAADLVDLEYNLNLLL
jgi:hypothetical protein